MSVLLAFIGGLLSGIALSSGIAIHLLGHYSPKRSPELFTTTSTTEFNDVTME